MGQPDSAAPTVPTVHYQDATKPAEARQHADRYGGAHGNTTNDNQRLRHCKWQQRDQC